MLCLLFSAVTHKEKNARRRRGAADARALSEEAATGDHANACRETNELDHGESVISSRLLLHRYRSGFLCDLTWRVASDTLFGGRGQRAEPSGEDAAGGFLC